MTDKSKKSKPRRSADFRIYRVSEDNSLEDDCLEAEMCQLDNTEQAIAWLEVNGFPDRIYEIHQFKGIWGIKSKLTAFEIKEA